MVEELVMGEVLRSEEELHERGFVLMDDEEFPLENNLTEILQRRNMTAAELSRNIGVTRQSVSFIIRGRMKPSIEFALKAAAVLCVDIKEMFRLKENAWIEPITTFRESAVFMNSETLEIIGKKARDKALKENGAEFLDIDSGKLLTKQEMDEIISTYKSIHKQDREQEVSRKHPELTYNEMKAEVNEMLNAELNERYTRLYKRIGKYSTTPRDCE